MLWTSFIYFSLMLSYSWKDWSFSTSSWVIPLASIRSRNIPSTLSLLCQNFVHFYFWCLSDWTIFLSVLFLGLSKHLLIDFYILFNFLLKLPFWLYHCYFYIWCFLFKILTRVLCLALQGYPSIALSQQKRVTYKH